MAETSVNGRRSVASGVRRAAGRARQDRIYRDGIHGRRPRVPTDFATLERRAKRKARAIGWAYAAGGAGEGATMRANREAFERWKIVPRMLRDVSRRDIGVELFGRRIPAPVLFGPVGAAELLHPEADVAIARAAAELGVPYIFTSQACAPMEECAAVMGEAPRWFQLYWSTDEGLVDSFLARARAAGAEAVVVTLDTTMLGWRTTWLPTTKKVACTWLRRSTSRILGVQTGSGPSSKVSAIVPRLTSAVRGCASALMTGPPSLTAEGTCPEGPCRCPTPSGAVL